ncbi:MAG: DUF4476 domain-containing protein [Verrucomicrobia bacterium]|nr:DUF4476 domain-containing protein [Cytophagales bacterium]
MKNVILFSILLISCNSFAQLSSLLIRLPDSSLYGATVGNKRVAAFGRNSLEINQIEAGNQPIEIFKFIASPRNVSIQQVSVMKGSLNFSPNNVVRSEFKSNGQLVILSPQNSGQVYQPNNQNQGNSNPQNYPSQNQNYPNPNNQSPQQYPNQNNPNQNYPNQPNYGNQGYPNSNQGYPNTDNQFSDNNYNNPNWVEVMPTPVFIRLKQTFRKATFDDNRMEIAHSTLRYSYFSSAQAAELMRTFDFDNQRLNFAKLVFPNILDKGNAFILTEKFDFPSNAREFARFMGR